MYQYVYYHSTGLVTLIINANNKKDADKLLKEFTKFKGEWTFQERIKNG